MGRSSSPESGNVIFFILIAIALIGLVTAALRVGSGDGANIDREKLAIVAAQVKQQAGEMEQAITLIINNGASESDIRFAHPDAHADYGTITTTPEFQVFDRAGGAATYRPAPAGVNDGSAWEFYGNTHMPQTGTDRAELLAVLPNVTAGFCETINRMNGYSATPTDGAGGAGTATCLYSGAAARFDAGTQFSATPNTTDEGTFSVKPAKEGCVRCTGDDSRHFFHVLMAR